MVRGFEEGVDGVMGRKGCYVSFFGKVSWARRRGPMVPILSWNIVFIWRLVYYLAVISLFTANISAALINVSTCMQVRKLQSRPTIDHHILRLTEHDDSQSWLMRELSWICDEIMRIFVDARE